MHYHCEVIMPPTDDVKKQLDAIMLPFSEHEEDLEHSSGHSFWDWYQIGGRWSGAKAQAHLDPEKIQEFYNELTRLGITVSGLVFGKQELKPENQIPVVDALWLEWFPESGFDSCPLFKHAGDTLVGDICEFDKMPLSMSWARVIIATPGYDPNSDDFHATFMVEDSIWNGVVHQQTLWDGTILHAVKMHYDRIAKYTEEGVSKGTIQSNWLTVTVDYHS